MPQLSSSRSSQTSAWIPSHDHYAHVRARARAPPSRSADVAAFVAGGLAAALGIAIGELMAGLIAGAPSLVIAIGDIVIENQPPGAKELVVELFGSNNKLALNVGIVITAIVIAGLLGVAGRRNFGRPRSSASASPESSACSRRSRGR